MIKKIMIAMILVLCMATSVFAHRSSGEIEPGIRYRHLDLNKKTRVISFEIINDTEYFFSERLRMLFCEKDNEVVAESRDFVVHVPGKGENEVRIRLGQGTMEDAIGARKIMWLFLKD